MTPTEAATRFNGNGYGKERSRKRSAEVIVEHWAADGCLNEARNALLAKSRLATRGDLCDDEVCDEFIGGFNIKLLASLSCGAHVDNYHPEWSALWVLAHDDGHVFHIASHRPKHPDKRIKTPRAAITQKVPLSVGQIVLFNAHRTHWLPRGASDKPFVGLSIDFQGRPSRETVNRYIENAASRFAYER